MIDRRPNHGRRTTIDRRGMESRQPRSTEPHAREPIIRPTSGSTRTDAEPTPGTEYDNGSTGGPTRRNPWNHWKIRTADQPRSTGVDRRGTRWKGQPGTLKMAGTQTDRKEPSPEPQNTTRPDRRNPVETTIRQPSGSDRDRTVEETELKMAVEAGGTQPRLTGRGGTQWKEEESLKGRGSTHRETERSDGGPDGGTQGDRKRFRLLDERTRTESRMDKWTVDRKEGNRHGRKWILIYPGIEGHRTHRPTTKGQEMDGDKWKWTRIDKIFIAGEGCEKVGKGQEQVELSSADFAHAVLTTRNAGDGCGSQVFEFRFPDFVGRWRKQWI
ncbi:hypothetical protein quinque_003546 [Culex quinquefasciatus]